MACVCRCLRFLPVNRIVSRNIAMSAQRRAEEALEQLKEKNPFFNKYAQKIAKLQQTAPEEFLERVDKVANPIKDGVTQTRTYSELLNPKQPLAKKAAPEIPHKQLADIMKLELIEDKSAEEVTKIWFEYHKTKEVLTAVLNVEQYKTLMSRAKDYPTFILPLPRSEGFEFFLLQFAANTVHFTPLLAYQVHAENAPESLTLVHYTEMKGKDVILMRGEYDNKVLSGQEAQCLANQLQMFYYMSDSAKLQLLKTFTANPSAFNHMDLIKEVENIQID